MKSKFPIIMLPTNKASRIDLFTSSNTLILANRNVKTINNQHLYILSDKEITKDCIWYIDDTNTVRKNVVNDADYWAVRKDYRAIIATTDILSTANEHSSVRHYKHVPRIPESFIPVYIDANNNRKQITEIDLDMEECNGDGMGGCCAHDICKFLKTTDNTVIIL